MAWITNCSRCKQERLIDSSLGYGPPVCVACTIKRIAILSSAISKKETKKRIIELEGVIATAKRRKDELEGEITTAQRKKAELEARFSDTPERVGIKRQRIQDILLSIKP